MSKRKRRRCPEGRVLKVPLKMTEEQARFIARINRQHQANQQGESERLNREEG